MRFGERLKLARTEKRMSVIGLSHKSGVAKSTIWNIENGKVLVPDGYTITDLCAAMNVSADYLLGLKPGRGDA